MSYRNRIYLSPQSAGEGRPSHIEWDAWSRAASHRLYGWLPADKDAACLDVGCGVGQGLHLLIREGCRNVMGVDVSPERACVARSICPRVEVADAIAFLREHPNKFDFISCFDVVEHFTKDELFEFLDALYGALRPGGRVVLQTPNADSPWGLGMRYGDLTHELAFSPASLGQALGLAGFLAVEARECGPYIHGAKSLIRTIAWKTMRVMLMLWNLVEMGNVGNGIFTRVFVMKAEKRAETSQ